MGLGGGRHLQGRAGLELWEPALRGWRPLSEPDNERKEVTRREFGQKVSTALELLAPQPSPSPQPPSAHERMHLNHSPTLIPPNCTSPGEKMSIQTLYKLLYNFMCKQDSLCILLKGR